MTVSRSSADVPSHHPRGPLAGPPTKRRWLLPIVILCVAILGIGSIVGWRLTTASGSRSGCSGQQEIFFVAVAPAQFPTFNGLAHQWNDTKPSYQGRCVAAAVVPKDPSQVANALGPSWDVVRDGSQPDVWIPDSGLWLAVAGSRPDAAAMLPQAPTSIASSPVVLAVRRPVMQALGWPQKQLGWQEVFGAFSNPDTWSQVGHPEWANFRVGITDPTVSTAGIASVLALLDQSATGTVSDQQFFASIGFTQSLGAVAADATTFFDAQKAPPGPATQPVIAAFPTLERDVVAYDADNPAMPMVPVYLPQNPVVADFPYTVLNAGWVNATHRAAATQFLRYLQSTAAQDTLRKQGLRAADQSVGSASLPIEQGFQTTVAPARKAPGAAALSQIIGQWTALQRKVNVLLALDTSGSMAEPVPGTKLTRLQLLQQAATTGFGLLTNQTSIGLWDFSIRTGQTTEYREVVPYGPLPEPVNGQPRQRVLTATTAALQAGGFTPLYDTIYAAWHDMQGRWQPNGTNAVVLITDGANELPGGLNLNQLLDKLTKEGRPDKPVQVIGIAVGPEADAAALQQISQVTGGRTFVAKDPAGAIQTMVLAFAGRLR
jgi:Ca-activated chloride channel family protein